MLPGRSVTAEEADALREVANIMIGHAATALARLSGTRVDIEIPDIRILPWRDGLKAASAGSGRMAGVRTQMLGNLPGEIFITFPRESALALADVLRGLEPGRTRYMSGPAASTVVEVGNILAGSCLAAFYQLLDISLVHSVPEFVYDAPDALLSRVAPDAPDAAHVLLAQVTFGAPDLDLRGHLMLLFTVESMSRLLDALHLEV